MVNVSLLLNKIGKFASDNSPLILTSIGVAGTIGTAVLTGNATWQAAKILNSEDRSPWDSDRFPDKVKLIWPLYIPAVGTAALTITAVILANRIGTRRAAAMAAAYSISERAFEEYRDKVVEKLGKNKEREVRDEVAQDRVNKNPVNTAEVIITGKGDVLFLDLYSNRYFTSTVEDVKKAMNDTNYEILNHTYASLNQFYDRVGLDHVQFGEDVGWTSAELLDIRFSTTMSKDSRPCATIDFTVEPVRDYFRTH